MTFFVNYMAFPCRRTTFNLTVARMLICAYGIWKVGSYPFGGLADYPMFVFTAEPLAAQNFFFAMPVSWLSLVVWEQAAICACLFLLGIGWRIGLMSFLAAFLLSHLSGLNYLIVNEKTFLPIIYFLILYGLFRGEQQTNASGMGDRAGCRLSCLRWFLLTLSLIYFFTGYAKLLGGGMSFDWASAANIRGIIQHNAIYHIHQLPRVADWVLSHDILCAMMGWSAMLLELGFVVAVLCRGSITPFILGLFAMHLGILLTMQLNYLTDMGILFLVFVPWDDIRTRIAEEE